MTVTSSHLAGVLGVFGFGVAVSILGALKLRICEERGLNNRQWGTITATLHYTILVGVLIAGQIVANAGHRTVMAVGFVVTGLALFWLCRARRYLLLILSVIVMALAASCLNVGGNTLLPHFIPGDKAAGSSLGNVFFGLGALLTPLIVAALLDRNVRLPVIGIVFGCLLIWPVIPALLADYEALIGSSAAAATEAVTEAGQDGGFMSVLMTPAIWISGIGLIFYAGMEAGFNEWATTYYRDVGWKPGRAGYVLAIFWVSFLVGRIVASQLGQLGFNLTESGGIVLVVTGSISLIVLLVLVKTHIKWLAVPMSILLGLMFAPGFPVLHGRALEPFSAGQEATAFGVFFAMGMLIYGLLTKLIGYLTDTRSIKAGFTVIACCCAGLVLTGIVMWIV